MKRTTTSFNASQHLTSTSTRWNATSTTTEDNRLDYDEEFRRSIEDPSGFWAEKAEQVHWFKKWDQVLDVSNPPFTKWFKGGQVNTCYNAIDRHIEQGRGNQVALIYDSPVTNTVQRYSYHQLYDHVTRAAGMLHSLGVSKGDRVLIYMPMVPEAVFTMLACARLGAVHIVVFGGFASDQLAIRIDHAKPKVIVSASCGVEPTHLVEYKPLLDKALAHAKHKVKNCIIYQRLGLPPATIHTEIDLDWAALYNTVAPFRSCVPVESSDPLYVLYTSGTTGNPKGVYRDNGGHLVALKYSMDAVYGVKPGETFWAGSDIGWVVGHSYIVYGPLIHGATSVLYEGKPIKTPDSGAYWRLISQHKVNVAFVAPTSLRAIKREDSTGEMVKKYDLSAFRTLFLAGERADPQTVRFAEEILHKPVIDHWWQTETGWAIGAKCMGLHTGFLPIKHGSCTKPVPGYDIKIMDHNAQVLPLGTKNLGDIVVKLPLPPGTFPTLWEADAKYVSTYFRDYPGYYNTGDAGYLDEQGYIYVMTRTDDVINVAGHRLTTGQIEEVLTSHPDVAESAVIGAHDDLKGEVPVGLIVPKTGLHKKPSQLVKETIEMVREHVGPVAFFKAAAVVDRLPKTRSGKILRKTMKQIADGVPLESLSVPPTIEDPSVLKEIEAALKHIGFAKPPAASSN